MENKRKNNLPILTLENEIGKSDEKINRKFEPVRPIRSAIRKHIHPNCITAKQAVEFSIKRNKSDPTEVNTVFQANPAEFHEDIVDGEKVKLVGTDFTDCYIFTRLFSQIRR